MIAFLLLALICLLMLGFACACLGDDAVLALERAQAPVLPAVIILWGAIVLGAFARSPPRISVVGHPGRGSPEQLQRFLF